MLRRAEEQSFAASKVMTNERVMCARTLCDVRAHALANAGQGQSEGGMCQHARLGHTDYGICSRLQVCALWDSHFFTNREAELGDPLVKLATGFAVTYPNCSCCAHASSCNFPAPPGE